MLLQSLEELAERFNVHYWESYLGKYLEHLLNTHKKDFHVWYEEETFGRRRKYTIIFPENNLPAETIKMKNLRKYFNKHKNMYINLYLTKRIPENRIKTITFWCE